MGEINCRLHEILKLIDLNKHHMSQRTGVRRATYEEKQTKTIKHSISRLNTRLLK